MRTRIEVTPSMVELERRKNGIAAPYVLPEGVQEARAWNVLIARNGEPIGEMHTPRRYTSMVVTGSFRPFATYERVRPFFQRLFETKGDPSHLYPERDALGLTVTTLDGRVVPTEWIEIGDASSRN